MEGFSQESLLKSVAVLEDIGKEEKLFYKTIKDKNIEPRSPEDLERVERFFNGSLTRMIKLLDGSSYEPAEKLLLKSNLIIRFHGEFAERYNFDFYSLPSLFGQHNNKLFTKAVEDLNKF